MRIPWLCSLYYGLAVRSRYSVGSTGKLHMRLKMGYDISAWHWTWLQRCYSTLLYTASKGTWQYGGGGTIIIFYACMCIYIHVCKYIHMYVFCMQAYVCIMCVCYFYINYHHSDSNYSNCMTFIWHCGNRHYMHLLVNAVSMSRQSLEMYWGVFWKTRSVWVYRWYQVRSRVLMSFKCS